MSVEILLDQYFDVGAQVVVGSEQSSNRSDIEDIDQSKYQKNQLKKSRST